MTTGDIILIIIAVCLYILSVYVRSMRYRKNEQRQKDSIRQEQLRSKTAGSNKAASEAKIGETMQELEISGFHPDVRYVFDDPDKAAPVHAEFAVDYSSQTVAYATAPNAFMKRTILQVNGCEIKENREFSKMVDEINLGMKADNAKDRKARAEGSKGSVSDKVKDEAGGGWMEGAAEKIISLSLILYTGRLMDPPVTIELLGKPCYDSYAKYKEAQEFAKNVYEEVNKIISARVR